MEDPLGRLTSLISGVGQDRNGAAREVLEALFGSRYHKRHFEKTAIRDALMLGADEDHSVPFAGLIHPDNPGSGPYGGMSLVWFPTETHGTLIGFVIGTRGLSPDEGILTRPGHRRRIAALRRMLASQGVEAWSKPDPASLGVSIPKTAVERFPGFEKAIKRYGREMYCMAIVTPENARSIVQTFLDLYSHERGWDIMAEFKAERVDLLGRLRQDLFPSITSDLVYQMLRQRHFVILQGPPGTGKTRLAQEICREHFGKRGMTIQFHPAVTYEDFVIGLSPNVSSQDSLSFGVRPGWLLQACRDAREAPFLLIIDEVNRADLGRILGEAIFLFEPDEVGNRTIELAHTSDGSASLTLPENLFVLGTMNTADRSIASVDLAIRRRFSFMTMMPERQVVADQDLTLAIDLFDRICDVFVEHAPAEALHLMPGHSYFLAKDETDLKRRLQYELLPLLDEYLREGYLGPATTELNAVRDALEDAVR